MMIAKLLRRIPIHMSCSLVSSPMRGHGGAASAAPMTNVRTRRSARVVGELGSGRWRLDRTGDDPGYGRKDVHRIEEASGSEGDHCRGGGRHRRKWLDGITLDGTGLARVTGIGSDRRA